MHARENVRATLDPNKENFKFKSCLIAPIVEYKNQYFFHFFLIHYIKSSTILSGNLKNLLSLI